MLVFVLIGNSMLEIHGMSFHYWLLLFTTSCWANLIGLIISAGLNSVVTIYILIPLFLVPQLLFSGVVVEFGKMNDKIASEKNVPFIGDVMTSRWAYEGLMVTQFKDNQFEKDFFEFEKVMKNATYYKSYCLPNLFKIEGDCETGEWKGQDTWKYAQNLLVIKSEIVKISNDLGWPTPTFLDSLSVANMNNKLCATLTNFLVKANQQYIVQYNTAASKKDEIYNNWVKRLGSSDAFIQYKQKYYNNQLAKVVTNDNELKDFDTQNGEVIRLKDAIFRTPEARNGRAHFYAPEKRILQLTIDTFWFNLLVIWLYSGLLFIILYYDVLRKIIAYFEIIRLNRVNRRRFLRVWVTEQPDMWKSSKK